MKKFKTMVFSLLLNIYRRKLLSLPVYTTFHGTKEGGEGTVGNGGVTDSGSRRDSKILKGKGAFVGTEKKKVFVIAR